MLRRQLLCLLGSLPVMSRRFAALAAPVANAMLRPAICAYSFRNELKAGSMKYEDVIRMAAETGADGVDLTTYWLPDTSAATLSPLRKLAYRSSVTIYSLGIRARMAQASVEARTQQVAVVGQGIEAAERLGASHIRVFGGDIPKGATAPQATAWAIETLRRCADEAGRRGITLGVEDDGGITTTAEQTLELVNGARSESVGVTLDVGNFEDDAYRQIELCAPFASNVHIKSHLQQDGRRQDADWPRILGILRRTGYRGHLALEYELNENPRVAVPRLIHRLRAAIAAA